MSVKTPTAAAAASATPPTVITASTFWTSVDLMPASGIATQLVSAPRVLVKPWSESPLTSGENTWMRLPSSVVTLTRETGFGGAVRVTKGWSVPWYAVHAGRYAASRTRDTVRRNDI